MGSIGPVLVTGAGGLLGREVAQVLQDAGHDVTALTHADFDVSLPSMVRDMVSTLRPASIVHCAAMTDVDGCETDPKRAWAVNAGGARVVAESAAKIGAEVVAISTDYVFDGEKGTAYIETDPPHPVQEYGRTKLAGEEFVSEVNPRHYVLRSAWIYGAGGKNFLSRLFPIVREHGRIKAVVDQTGSPTYAPDLAQEIATILGSGAYGLYHVTNEGSCTFAEFCRFALKTADLPADIEDVSWRDLGRAAPRPANTTLDNPAWRDAGFERLRGWQEAAAAFVREAT